MRSANALALLPLAIGVVNEAARVPGPHRIPPETSQTAAGCNVPSLADCPVNGCAPPGSGHAALNQRKRTIPGGGSPTVLTFADFKQLQTEAGVLFPPKRELEIPAADRAKLSDLKYSTGTVSEGDLVQAIGFIVADPRPEAGESVNCGLTGMENNDFHIPLGPAVGPDMDFQGIVVEMIPQDRNPNWTIPRLQDVQSKNLQIRVTGQLLYDSIHVPNSDPGHVIGGQPHRMSLWEVHPVTEFLVCAMEDGSPKARCDPSRAADWLPIENYPAPPPGHATEPGSR